MYQFNALPILDLISLAMLVLIAAILLINRSLAPRSKADDMVTGRDLGPILTGGITFEPDTVLDDDVTDTNDPLLIVYNTQNRYLGPDQTALALTLLDPGKDYAEISGHIPADHPAYLDPNQIPDRIGSTDPAASSFLFLLNPASLLAEEALEGTRLAVIPVLRAVIILLALIPLLYRLLLG